MRAKNHLVKIKNCSNSDILFSGYKKIEFPRKQLRSIPFKGTTNEKTAFRQ